MTDSYDVRASEFAYRAKELIASKQAEQLFYAALEVRMGVEARLQEYVRANAEIHSHLRNGWRIHSLAKGLDEHFQRARDSAQVTISIRGEKDPVLVLRYTPVCAELEVIAQRLGDYLHFRTHRVVRNHEWWKQFRELVTRGQFLLEVSCSGNLLGPLIFNPVTKQLKYAAEPSADANVDYGFLNAIAAAWNAVEVSVVYTTGSASIS